MPIPLGESGAPRTHGRARARTGLNERAAALLAWLAVAAVRFLSFAPVGTGNPGTFARDTRARGPRGARTRKDPAKPFWHPLARGGGGGAQRDGCRAACANMTGFVRILPAPVPLRAQHAARIRSQKGRTIKSLRRGPTHAGRAAQAGRGALAPATNTAAELQRSIDQLQCPLVYVITRPARGQGRQLRLRLRVAAAGQVVVGLEPMATAARPRR
jgi:hypothetical protein